uniref:NAD(P)-binding domain-containing protein n=1 Tax=Globodera rostochiensis TaxID=31243 RepID=A0A914GVE2_GLORO
MWINNKVVSGKGADRASLIPSHPSTTPIPNDTLSTTAHRRELRHKNLRSNLSFPPAIQHCRQPPDCWFRIRLSNGRQEKFTGPSTVLLPKKVLVTGGCGFIGSNFINYIFGKWPDASFVNLDKLAFGASPEHIVDDIRSSHRYVFVHGTIQENVIATTTLLEAINFYGQVRRLVHISTDEVYGDSMDDATPKCEDSPLNPTNPYAASKAACEVIVRSYHHSYKLPYVMVRMNNVYGPRQAYSKLIPKFTRLALEGKPYPLMGDGMHSRSWMYVDDCAEAIRRIAERGRIGQTYNIGTEFEKCNLHLTEMLHEKVQKLMDRGASKLSFQPVADRPYHDRRYYINFTKIREELGWECTVPFDQGLAATLDYYVREYRKTHRNLSAAERPHG